MRLGSAAAPGVPPHRVFTDASSPAARSQGGASPTTAEVSPTGLLVLRHGGRPGPGSYPARFRALVARCVSHQLGPRGKQGEGAWGLESKGCGLRSDCALAQTPVPSWRTVCLDGVGSIPAGHVLSVNKLFHQHVPLLSSHCVCLLATSRPLHHTSALTAGGEEALARDMIFNPKYNMNNQLKNAEAKSKQYE